MQPLAIIKTNEIIVIHLSPPICLLWKVSENYLILKHKRPLVMERTKLELGDLYEWQSWY